MLGARCASAVHHKKYFSQNDISSKQTNKKTQITTTTTKTNAFAKSKEGGFDF